MKVVVNRMIHFISRIECYFTRAVSSATVGAGGGEMSILYSHQEDEFIILAAREDARFDILQ